MAISYASPPSADIQVKAEVLRDLMQAVPTSDSSYGLDLPKEQLQQLETFFEHKIKLFSVKEYVRRYKKSGRDLVSTCFWIKVSSLNSTQAVVKGGVYPLSVMTKYGPMPANTTDFVYHLIQKNDQWKIVTKDVSGAT
jgi:hypothetical protein